MNIIGGVSLSDLTVPGFPFEPCSVSLFPLVCREQSALSEFRFVDEGEAVRQTWCAQRHSQVVCIEDVTDEEEFIIGASSDRRTSEGGLAYPSYPKHNSPSPPSYLVHLPEEQVDR